VAIALASLGGVLGFALGWLAHRRLSLHYKERWLQAVGMLNSKALEGSEDLGRQASREVVSGTPQGATTASRYIAGKWALDERHDLGIASFYAIRAGFDDVLLGTTRQFERYKGLYRMNRSNAEQAIQEMNQR